jgi:hypothetical protein
VVAYDRRPYVDPTVDALAEFFDRALAGTD